MQFLFKYQFLIELNENMGACKIQLFGLIGNHILDQALISFQTEILPTGVYFLKYFNDYANENFKVIKIVKQ